MRSIAEMVESMQAAMLRAPMVDEPTFECPTCLDLGFTHPGRDRKGREGNMAKFCESCRRGITSEAGAWAELLMPKGKAKVNERHKGQFMERMRMHPSGVELRDAVESAMSKPTDLSVEHINHGRGR